MADFWGGIRRMFTLPKSRNSIDDLLGKEMAAAVKALALKHLTEGVASIFAHVDAPLFQLEGHTEKLIFDLFPALKKNADLAERVREIIGEAFESNVYLRRDQLAGALVAEIKRALKL